MIAHWYVEALLWLAKPRMNVMRAVAGMLLYLLFVLLICSPMVGCIVVLDDLRHAFSQSWIVLLEVGLYVASSAPAVVRFGRRRDELRKVGYGP